MTTYYTAQDIEELAAQGVRQIEIGSGVTLTDFARDTAVQFGIVLVDSSKQAAAPAGRPAQVPVQPAAPRPGGQASDRYNKPRGCQHASSFSPAAASRTAGPAAQAASGSDSTTVNRLIDLMGKVIKRGE